MSGEFESIFSSKTNVDPKLSGLFKKKTVDKKDHVQLVISSRLAAKQAEESKQKEELAKKGDVKKIKRDPESEKRTIFVGNLHKDCQKNELLKLFKAYGSIESVRFRNIVPEDLLKPKKYAFITHQMHPNKKTINAFVRFKDENSAKRAVDEANGMEYNSHHLRIDIAANSKAHDNKRSVFLGGLPFDIEEDDVHKHFAECGPIENVRIVRHNRTGVGKGFGYVQFKTADSIQLALKLEGSSLRNRKIRVTRCVKKQKEKKDKQGNRPSPRGGQKGAQKGGRDQRPVKRFKNERPAKVEKDGDKSKAAPAKDNKRNEIKKKKKKMIKKRHVSTNKKV